MKKCESVWIFCGDVARFPSAVFTSIEKAEQWIAQKKVSGMLTEYPVDISCYEWALAYGYFEEKESDKNKLAMRFQTFTSASQKHFHYEKGIR